MTLSFAQCRGLNAENLAQKGAQLSSSSETFSLAAIDTVQGVNGLGSVSWSGKSRTAAEKAVANWAAQLADAVNVSDKSATHIEHAATDLGVAVSMLHSAVSAAENAGFSVDAVTGSVTAGAVQIAAGGSGIAHAAAQLWSSLIGAIVSLISLRDELLAIALHTVLMPYQLAMLRPSRKESTIGSLDVPPAEPAAASHINALKRAELAADIAQIEQSVTEKERIFGPGHPAVLIEKQKLQSMLGLSAALQAPDTYLLQYSEHGAAVSVGNPDNAQTVATYVPGTSSNLQGMQSYTSVATTLAQAGGGAASATAGQPGSTAVVAWLDYPAPKSVIGAASPQNARDGARALQQFQNRLSERSGGEQQLIVVGHSYGSTVVGAAAQGPGLRADAVVLVGSPGVGQHSATDFVLVNGHGRPQAPDEVAANVHATTLPNDPIGLIGSDDFGPHGPDPAQPGFGAHVFDSESPSWQNHHLQHDWQTAHTRGYWQSPAFQERWRDLVESGPRRR